MGAISYIKDEFEAELPVGLIYREDCFSEGLEREIIVGIEQLGLEHIETRGQVTKRSIAQFGATFGYGRVVHGLVAPLPSWLIDFREIVANVVPIAPEKFESLIVQKYPIGAGIGWHCDDEDLYGVIVGASLAARGRMLFRRAKGERAHGIDLAPRSVYALTGPSRWCWEHRVAPVTQLRYSLTYRTLRGHPRSTSFGTAVELR